MNSFFPSKFRKSKSDLSVSSSTFTIDCTEITDNKNFSQMIYYREAIENHIDIGLKEMGHFISNIEKLSDQYKELGTKLCKSYAGEKPTDEAKLTCSSFYQNTTVGLKNYASNHRNFAEAIRESILIPLKTSLKQMKEEKQLLHDKCKKNMKILENNLKQVNNAKNAAISEIKREFLKDYLLRMTEKNLKPLYQYKMLRKVTESLRPSYMRGDEGSSSYLRIHFNLAVEYNQKMKDYYAKIMKNALMKMERIEFKRIQISRDAILCLPKLFETHLKQEVKLPDESNVISIETELSSLANYIMMNKPKDAQIFSEYYETSIDKDGEILRIKKEINDIYDTPLNELIQFDQNKDLLIPLEIKKSIEEIRKRGLGVEGIFRISANAKSVNKAMQRLMEKDIEGYLQMEIHVCSSFLKRFLQQLPGNVIEKKFHSVCFEWGKMLRENGDAKKNEIKKELEIELKKFSVENSNLLHEILEFLSLVSTYSDQNRMDKHNLAVIFAVILFPFGKDSNQDFGIVQDIICLVEFLIEIYNELNWNVNK